MGYLESRTMKMQFKPRMVPLGDSSLLVQLGDEIDLAVNQRVHALASLIEASSIDGIIETVPAYATLLVHYDPFVLSFTQIKDYLHTRIVQAEETISRTPRQVQVPVRYGGEYGPDLEFVASHCGFQVEDVIRIHTERIYTILTQLSHRDCRRRERACPREPLQSPAHRPGSIRLTRPVAGASSAGHR
jgi:allophanate hydrolase subunit 1